MWHYYWLQPTVTAEPDPVMLLVHVTDETRDSLEMLLYVAGAQTLRARSGLSPAGIRLMMHAGASWSRWEGVRLSNGFNVIDPSDWHRQGIGTVALNLMIAWAKHHHPEAKVRPVELTRRQKEDIALDDPRLGFYRRFGLDWDSADQKADAPDWKARPTTVAQLRAAPLSPRLQYIKAPW